MAFTAKAEIFDTYSVTKTLLTKLNLIPNSQADGDSHSRCQLWPKKVSQQPPSKGTH